MYLMDHAFMVFLSIRRTFLKRCSTSAFALPSSHLGVSQLEGNPTLPIRKTSTCPKASDFSCTSFCILRGAFLVTQSSPLSNRTQRFLIYLILSDKLGSVPMPILKLPLNLKTICVDSEKICCQVLCPHVPTKVLPSCSTKNLGHGTPCLTKDVFRGQAEGYEGCLPTRQVQCFVPGHADVTPQQFTGPNGQRLHLAKCQQNESHVQPFSRISSAIYQQTTYHLQETSLQKFGGCKGLE